MAGHCDERSARPQPQSHHECLLTSRTTTASVGCSHYCPQSSASSCTPASRRNPRHPRVPTRTHGRTTQKLLWERSHHLPRTTPPHHFRGRHRHRQSHQSNPLEDVRTAAPSQPPGSLMLIPASASCSAPWTPSLRVIWVWGADLACSSHRLHRTPLCVLPTCYQCPW
jgi:hypothetical protein